jgi:hypothetical protein
MSEPTNAESKIDAVMIEHIDAKLRPLLDGLSGRAYRDALDQVITIQILRTLDHIREHTGESQIDHGP